MKIRELRHREITWSRICSDISGKGEEPTLGELPGYFFSYYYRTMFYCLTLVRLPQILDRETQRR